MLKLRRHLLPQIKQMHVTDTETYPGFISAPLDVDASSIDSEIILHRQVLFKNNQIYWHHLMQINYTTYDVCRAQDSINPSTDHQDIILLSDTPTSTMLHRRYLPMGGGLIRTFLREVLTERCNVLGKFRDKF